MPHAEQVVRQRGVNLLLDPAIRDSQSLYQAAFQLIEERRQRLLHTGMLTRQSCTKLVDRRVRIRPIWSIDAIFASTIGQMILPIEDLDAMLPGGRLEHVRPHELYCRLFQSAPSGSISVGYWGLTSAGKWITVGLDYQDVTPQAERRVGGDPVFRLIRNGLEVAFHDDARQMWNAELVIPPSRMLSQLERITREREEALSGRLAETRAQRQIEDVELLILRERERQCGVIDLRGAGEEE